MWVAPLLVYIAAPLATLLIARRRYVLGLLSSGVAIFGVISTAGLSLFPFLLPSALDPASSLTVWDASSSRLTLTIMLVVTLIFLPIILAYTAWVFSVLRGRVTASAIADTRQHNY
jgi:cytochrome d ubiquinol oxidase subunit II